MTRKVLLIIALASLLLTTLHAAEAKPPKKSSSKESSFVGIGLGITEYAAFDSGYSLMLTAGKSLPHVAEKFGLEAAFSKSLIAPAKNNLDLSVTTLAGYATYGFELSPQVDLKAKLGAVYQRLATTTTKTSTELSYGFMIDYPLDKDKSFYLDYTIIEKDIAILSAGLLFQF